MLAKRRDKMYSKGIILIGSSFPELHINEENLSKKLSTISFVAVIGGFTLDMMLSIFIIVHL